MNFLNYLYQKAVNDHWVYTDWFPLYKDCIEKFNHAAIKENWDDEILDLLLRHKKGHCISENSQGQFSNQEIEKIKKDWDKILPLIKEISKKNTITQEEYENIDEFFRQRTKKYKKAMTHRVVASFLPNYVTTLIDNEKLNLVVNKLKEKLNDYPEKKDNWLEDNINFIQYVNQNITFKHPWHSSLWGWYLYTIIEEERNFEQYWEEYKKKEEIMREYNNLKNKIINLLKSNKNIILHGAPGTGKTYLAKEIAKELTGCKENNNCDKHVGFVQFHPSYDYTDFVEGLRPVEKENGEIGFELKDGIFMEFCKRAKKYTDNKYIFIIDEINRADISKVFGELFFAIEPGYRGEKGKVKTQYSNLRKGNDKEFYVPENVYIIGTMNDIDRSVESFDFAIRRRFAWIEIKAEDTMEAILLKLNADKKEEAKSRLRALNGAIEQISGLNSSYHIGAAYFLKLKEYNYDFEKLWSYHLEPLLLEYLRGLPEVEELLKELKSRYDNPDKKEE